MAKAKLAGIEEAAKHYAMKNGGTIKDAKESIQNTINTLEDLLIDGNGIQFVNSLSLERVERAAKQGRNPQTGLPMPIPASISVRLKIGKGLKSRLNG